MDIPKPPHSWRVTPKAAIEIQRRLAHHVSTAPASGPFRLVAGADINFSRDGTRAIAAVVVWDVAARRVVETRTASARVTFPYVPGLLSFREGPVVIAAIRKLQCEPDAFLFDGQGVAHPRRFGLASHLGMILDRPSAGCGKSRLVGEYAEPGRRRGSRRALTHQNERIGTVLRTRENVRCLFISVGHRMNLLEAETLVLACGDGFRLPEPTRLADKLVADLKRGKSLIAP